MGVSKMKSLEFVNIEGSDSFTLGKMFRWHWAALMRARQADCKADKAAWLRVAQHWREIYRDRHSHPHYHGK
jgi:hypothetical protein